MNITVKLLDGSKIYPIYEPSATTLYEVPKFYHEKFEANEILGYAIVNDDKTVLQSEGYII